MIPSAAVVETGSDWVSAIRFANQLLRSGQRVLQVTGSLGSEFAPGGPSRGDFVIPLSPVADAGLEHIPDVDDLQAEADAADVQLRPWGGTGGVVAVPLRPVVVGLYGGGGAPFNQAAILAACGFALRFLSDAEIRAGALDDVDVLAVPGGGFRAMHGQIEPLGEEGCRAIANWVRHGGAYVGSCAGSYACAVTPDSFVASCPAQRHLQLINARVWNGGPDYFSGLQSPGVGVVTVRNERPDHPVMFGLPASFAIAHYNGPIFDAPVPAVVDGASEAVGLAAFAGWTERFTPAEAFMGDAVSGQTLLEGAISAGRYAMVAGHLGAGRVVAFGSHPEFGSDLTMIEWSLPARLLANAVLWQAMAAPTKSRSNVGRPLSGPVSFPAGAALTQVTKAAAGVRERAATLRAHSIVPSPSWLTPDYAMSFFGVAPDRIWIESLESIDAMTGEIVERAISLRQRVETLMAARAGDDLDTGLLVAVEQIERWVLDERPPEWHQDGGYQGVLALLRTASQMCDEAQARWDVELGPPDGAYGYMFENPYHLVAGSYLAAVGCVAGALCLLRALDNELMMAERLARYRHTDTHQLAITTV